MRVRKGQKGLSLIEVTIMLLVLMLLTSVLAPSIFDFVNDAQWVKVKEDCEAIAISVARLHRDVGSRLYTGGGVAAYPGNKVDIIYSDGAAPIVTAVDAAAAFGAVRNWYGTDQGEPLDPVRMSSCSDQLITNTIGGVQIYPEPGNPLPVPFGPYFGQGWRGAYLSPPCASDPWGHTYQVNTKWATMTFGAVAPGTTIPHCYDVFCVSAGKDGIISTPYGPAVHPSAGGTFRMGDDWTTVIAPCDP